MKEEKIKKIAVTRTKMRVPWLDIPDELNLFTPKQIAFVAEYQKTMNATKACIAAYNTTKDNAQSMAFEVSNHPSVRAAMKKIQQDYLDAYNPKETVDEIQEQIDNLKFNEKVIAQQAVNKAGVIINYETRIDTNPQALQALAMKVKMYDSIMRARNMEGLHSRNKIDVNNTNGNMQVNFVLDSALFPHAATNQQTGTSRDNS